MTMGNSLKSFYRRGHHVTNNRVERAEPSLYVQIHIGKETKSVVSSLPPPRLETKDGVLGRFYLSLLNWYYITRNSSAVNHNKKKSSALSS